MLISLQWTEHNNVTISPSLFFSSFPLSFSPFLPPSPRPSLPSPLPPSLPAFPLPYPPFLPNSAGVGRTGTFITIDIALQQAENESKVDIPAIITKLRTQRMKMVQTVVSAFHSLMEPGQ